MYRSNRRTLTQLFRGLACTVAYTGIMAGTAGLEAIAAPADYTQAQQRVAVLSRDPFPRYAQGTQKQTFNLPAQPLASALKRYSEQTGIQLAYNSPDLTGRMTDGLAGTFTPREALRQLLKDSNVEHDFTSNDAVVIRVAQANTGTATDANLGVINVQGDGETSASGDSEESAYGPVDGIVAKKSATGTKTDAPIIEVPRSLSVVTADQIEVQGLSGIGGVNDALRYTPGVVAEPLGVAPSRNHLNIRGFRSEDVVYRDGLKGHGRGFLIGGMTDIDTYGVERVEVLRGPASVLYGSGVPGGFVNLVTKRPTQERFVETEGLIRSFDQIEGRFDFGGPIGDQGRWSYRMTGMARDGETQLDIVDTSRLFLAPALTFEPSSKTTFTFLGQYQDDKSFDLNAVPASGTILANPNGKITSNRYYGEPHFFAFDTEYYSAGYILDHEFSDSISLHHQLRYEDVTHHRERASQLGFQADLMTLNRQEILGDESGEFLTTDTNIQIEYGNGSIENTLLLGIDYKIATAMRDQSSGPAPSINAFNPVYGATITNSAGFFQTDSVEDLDQLGMYAQMQSKFFDRWILTLGGRQDWAGSELNNKLTSTITTRDDDAFTRQAGLTYLFRNGLAPYASYAESFEPQGGTDFAGTPFEPTTGTQYEAGIKYEPTGFNGLFTLAVFDIARQNLLTADPVNLGFNVQTGEVTVRGLEIEGKAEIREGLNVIGSYSYIDAEVTKSNGTDLGKVPTITPMHTASFWMDYTFQSGQLDGFGLGGGVRYVGSSFGDTLNTVKVPSFTLFDAEVHYDFKEALEGVRFAVNANNLLDEEYISGCLNANACYFGSRRVVTASVKKRW